MATLLNSTIGCNNIGRNASNSYTTTVMGTCTGTGNNNTAIGINALACSTNVQNTGVGYKAGWKNTGYCNVMVGSCAMGTTTTGAGCRNTAGGFKALYGQRSSRDNVGVGYSAGLGTAYNSVQNTWIGAGAGSGNGNNNQTGIGYNANAGGGGTEITAIGAHVLSGGTGEKTVGIGYSINTTTTTSVLIGHSVNVGGDSHIVWGNGNNSSCNCLYGAWTYGSDCRDKTDIQPLVSNLGLNFLRRLRPVSYKWDQRDRYVRNCGFEWGQKDGTLIGDKNEYGFIAQEIKSTLDELGVRWDGLNHNIDKDAYRMAYADLIAPIIKSLQELDERVQALKLKVGV